MSQVLVLELISPVLEEILLVSERYQLGSKKTEIRILTLHGLIIANFYRTQF